MNLIDEYDPELEVGDRIVVDESAGALVGEAGQIVAADFDSSLARGAVVVFVRLDSGKGVRAYTSCLIKSPYQNEPLEVVPNV